jgi:hypothetical protein
MPCFQNNVVMQKWDVLMEWMDKQGLLDGVEQFLVYLFKVKQEHGGMEKVRNLLLHTGYAKSQFLER